MSFLDRVVAAITPLESDEARLRARQEARLAATPGDWLSAILDQHEQIERAFDDVHAAEDAPRRAIAQKRLAAVLTAHANAEESVLYPEVADSGHKTHASMAYEEQALTKVQLALLEKLPPMSQEYIEKLDHIRGAVLHHMYQEESSWFLDLARDIPSDRQRAMAGRFEEEFARYSLEPEARADAL